MVKRWIMLLIIMSNLTQCTKFNNKSGRWAWIYRKEFSARQRINNNNKTIALFAKENIPVFSQLMFSWNAIRPIVGYYSFFVSARNAHTKQWGIWHRMIDWGTNVQRSHFGKSDGFTRYVYVRLETENDQVADAFRIKIEACEGANLSYMHSFTVALSHYPSFVAETYGEHLAVLSSVHIDGVSRIAQGALNHEHNHRLCSPTSCTMLVRYLSDQNIDPLNFALNAYDSGLDAYGSWPFNMAHAFERCDGKISFFVARLNSFTDVHRQLMRNIPVVVSVRGFLRGAPKQYNNGHLLVVVGWDAQKRDVICHDPAFNDDNNVTVRYPINSFIAAWERSRRLTYWAEPHVSGNQSSL